jgi:hypothetical protein|tara:strand:+ start:199 stop:312 length:114 start_codon:yes stop_codon:yes gene_type:complete
MATPVEARMKGGYAQSNVPFDAISVILFVSDMRFYGL